MSIKEILRLSIVQLRTSNSPSPELDAKVLICHALAYEITELYREAEKELSKKQVNEIEKLIRQRQNGEPIAYITGHKEFYGLDFLVNKNVLIPRPETEFLVEQGIKFIESRLSSIGLDPSNYQYSKFNILDTGTGSGCIVISIFKSLQQINKSAIQQFVFFAVDNSLAALKVAKENAKIYDVDNNITFLESNLLNNPQLPDKFDLILANLPYVPALFQQTASGLQLKFEPQEAIFAEDNGAEIIKEFLHQSKNRLNLGGMIILELDPINATVLKNLSIKLFPKAKISIKKDLAQMNRYLIIEN